MAHPVVLVAIAIGIGAAIGHIFKKATEMARPKVFVSYDHSEDVHYKRLLQAWDANPDFDFDRCAF